MIMKCMRVKGPIYLVFFSLFLTVVSSGTTCQGSFVAIDNGVLYQLPYPRVSELPIRQFNLAVSTSLQSPSSYDIGQTLKVIVEEVQYTIILGESSLECFKNSSTDPLLRYVDSWPYPDGYRPTRLVSSNQNPESFYLMFEEHSPLNFGVDESELYDGILLTRDPEAISIVVNSEQNDVIVTTISPNQLSLFSVFDFVITQIISLRDYCEQIVSLYSLPAISQDRNVSFVVNCTTIEGTQEMYHVVVSYKSLDTFDVVSIASGVPIGSSSYLAIRSGNLVTVHNRIHISDGVPQSHDFGSEVLKVVVFESDNHTSFLVNTDSNIWMQIDAEEFFYDPSQGVQTLPGMLQGSCDPAMCPYAIVDNGFVVASRDNDLRYDIVLFTFESSLSTFTETARVTGLPQSPSFVTFLPDPNAPTPSTLPTTEVDITETTIPPTISPTENETMVTTSPPEQSEQSALVIILPTIAAFVVIVIVVIIVLVFLMRKKGRRSRFQPQPSKDDGKQLSASTADKKYSCSTEETGDTESSYQASEVTQETGSTKNVSAVIDPGYVSSTPLSGVRSLDSSSRQSTYSSSTSNSSDEDQNV